MLVSYAQYTYPVSGDASVFGRIDEQYVGKAFSDLDNATALTYGDFTDFNLQLGLDVRKLELVGFVDNVGNSRGITSALRSLAVPIAIRQQPRTFGLTVRAKF